MYGMLYWLHFTAGILQMIFLYSFRGVGAMEIVAMDMKVRSIVFLTVKMLNHSRKKGIDQVMYLQFQITEFQSNFLILFTNLIPRSFLI